jgi:hypothetical protein
MTCSRSGLNAYMSATAAPTSEPAGSDITGPVQALHNGGESAHQVGHFGSRRPPSCCDGRMNSNTVQGVVARMRAIAAEVPAGDGAGVFNEVYLRVTEVVQDRLTAGGFYSDDVFMADLDVRFANLWFAAYDAVDDVPRAWAPLLAARSRRGVLPIQFALAGMNSHIENDLPLAVIRTCAARGRTPTSHGVREDYEKVNDVLADVEAEIRRTFLTEVGQAVDDHLEPVAHLVSSWKLAKARDVAWVNVQTLWELRRVRPLFEAYVATLDRTVGMGSRLLLTSLT